MCLELFIKPGNSSKQTIGAQRLADASGLHVRKQETLLGRALQFSAAGACSCDLMARGQSNERDTWALDTNHLEGLAAAVSAMAKETRDFVFCAHWLGEDLAPAQRVKLGALIELIRSNAIGRNVPYVLGAAHA